jgi:hypothetical protein
MRIEQQMVRPSCQARNRSTANFCHRCRFSLSDREFDTNFMCLSCETRNRSRTSPLTRGRSRSRPGSIKLADANALRGHATSSVHAEGKRCCSVWLGLVSYHLVAGQSLQLLLNRMTCHYSAACQLDMFIKKHFCRSQYSSGAPSSLSLALFALFGCQAIMHRRTQCCQSDGSTTSCSLLAADYRCRPLRIVGGAAVEPVAVVHRTECDDFLSVAGWALPSLLGKLLGLLRWHGGFLGA